MVLNCRYFRSDILLVEANVDLLRTPQKQSNDFKATLKYCTPHNNMNKFIM